MATETERPLRADAAEGRSDRRGEFRPDGADRPAAIRARRKDQEEPEWICLSGYPAEWTGRKFPDEERSSCEACFKSLILSPQALGLPRSSRLALTCRWKTRIQGPQRR